MKKDSDLGLMIEEMHSELNEQASIKLNSAEIANIDQEFLGLNFEQKVIFELYRAWIDVHATPKECLATYVGQIFKNDDLIYAHVMEDVVHEFSVLYNFLDDHGVDIFGNTSCTFGRFSFVINGSTKKNGFVFLTENS